MVGGGMTEGRQVKGGMTCMPLPRGTNKGGCRHANAHTPTSQVDNHVTGYSLETGHRLMLDFSG